MADARCTKAIKSPAWADIRRRRRKGSMTTRTRAGKMKPARYSEEFSMKLEALKNLIPPSSGGCGETSGPGADELFRETADYILQLKAQVVVLQSLIKIYGSADQVDGDNAA
ncbi:hypothetical protein MLD38_034733 [Melastoma candidum]|uniref:Uncharacterized protein n=1 Tax=Melastoma candidum TaxID=119954 RepID=A0ACB9MAV0_9MYRT|nr:hypothetical protein MLD38_034733 [Melastoma candidum]